MCYPGFSCYMLVRGQVTGKQASADICTAAGADLVAAETAEEYDVINAFMVSMDCKCLLKPLHYNDFICNKHTVETIILQPMVCPS